MYPTAPSVAGGAPPIVVPLVVPAPAPLPPSVAEPAPTVRRRETLEERVARLGISQRDCRECPMFVPSPTGLAFGWCNAHEQYVKLHHGGFFSQCQFKTLSRVTAGSQGTADS